MRLNLSTPIADLPRVGPQYQKRLKRLGIKTIRDLVFHFPRRYEDFSDIIPISQAEAGRIGCFLGKILEIKNSRTWKRKMTITQAVVSDRTGAIRVVWFNQPYITNVLKEKDIVCLVGKVARAKEGIYLSSPAYEKISSRGRAFSKRDLIHTARIVPVYPETEGLSSRWLRMLIMSILKNLKDRIPESIPEKIRKENKLLPLNEAIWQVHFPDSFELAEKAKERFSFEEIFFIELLVLSERLKINRQRAFPIPIDLKLCRQFVGKLPFQLTDAQKKAAWQILKDMEKPRPMNRLLEGDVGSGKTVVATLAFLSAVKTGFQAAFLVPTEVLAKQHFANVSDLLDDFKVKIGLLTGKEGRIKIGKEEVKISQKKIVDKTKEGEIDLLIGTHALIQDRVRFRRLAFVAVDEQHRFGVEQRARLCEGNAGQAKLIPHLLSMTATPIPRTLALTVYGDLDISIIDQMPKGRKKVITKIVSPKERGKTYDFIRKKIREGRQAFVICPRIEPVESSQGNASEKSNQGWAEVKAVKEEYKKLSKEIFPDLKVAQLHGRMKPEEKEKIMEQFSQGKIDILVSTSVVEVGIDIPNATIMVIEGAERFGLAQLYQFRGRVGRGRHQSYCFLLTSSYSRKTASRLRALISCENGFELAEEDLKIRGPGDFFGTRQWGVPDLAMSSFSDMFLVEKARNLAKEILEKDPKLKTYPGLAQHLALFREKVHME
ncbi:ATP-dependent DNA helicase RecG [bacterium]|nr:ATP-dependent DNA helicase RecG [bacterium]